MGTLRSACWSVAIFNNSSRIHFGTRAGRPVPRTSCNLERFFRRRQRIRHLRTVIPLQSRRRAICALLRTGAGVSTAVRVGLPIRPVRRREGQWIHPAVQSGHAAAVHFHQRSHRRPWDGNVAA